MLQPWRVPQLTQSHVEETATHLRSWWPEPSFPTSTVWSLYPTEFQPRIVRAMSAAAEVYFATSVCVKDRSITDNGLPNTVHSEGSTSGVGPKDHQYNCNTIHSMA